LAPVRSLRPTSNDDAALTSRSIASLASLVFLALAVVRWDATPQERLTAATAAPIFSRAVGTPVAERGSVEQVVGDGVAQHFAGPLVDLVELGVAVVPLDREVPGVAVAAVDLDGLVGDLSRYLRGVELRLGGLLD